MPRTIRVNEKLNGWEHSCWKPPPHPIRSCFPLNISFRLAGLTSRGVWLVSPLLSSIRCQTSWIHCNTSCSSRLETDQASLLQCFLLMGETRNTGNIRFSALSSLSTRASVADPRPLRSLCPRRTKHKSPHWATNRQLQTLGRLASPRPCWSDTQPCS